MERNIETIINLDIRKWPGKTQRLVSSIDRYMNAMVETYNPETTFLPNHLVMSRQQYESLKRVRNMGDSKQWKTHRPDQRLYFTAHNVFEITIK